jgi:sporulation protein YlmC with PRC-barrel domain
LIRALVVRRGFILQHDVEIPVSAIEGGREGELRLPPPPPRRDQTAVRWYTNNAEITEGNDVISRDGHKIGEVHAVTLEPTTGRPVSLVVRRGLLFAREIELAAELVRFIGERMVYVDLDARQAREYAEARSALHPA